MPVSSQRIRWAVENAVNDVWARTSSVLPLQSHEFFRLAERSWRDEFSQYLRKSKIDPARPWPRWAVRVRDDFVHQLYRSEYAWSRALVFDTAATNTVAAIQSLARLGHTHDDDVDDDASSSVKTKKKKHKTVRARSKNVSADAFVQHFVSLVACAWQAWPPFARKRARATQVVFFWCQSADHMGCVHRVVVAPDARIAYTCLVLMREVMCTPTLRRHRPHVGPTRYSVAESGIAMADDSAPSATEASILTAHVCAGASYTHHDDENHERQHDSPYVLECFQDSNAGAADADAEQYITSVAPFARAATGAMSREHVRRNREECDFFAPFMEAAAATASARDPDSKAVLLRAQEAFLAGFNGRSWADMCEEDEHHHAKFWQSVNCVC